MSGIALEGIDDQIKRESSLIAGDVLGKLRPGEDSSVCEVYVDELYEQTGELARADRRHGFVGEVASGLLLPVLCGIIVNVVKERYLVDPAEKNLGAMAKQVYDAAIRNGLPEEDALKITTEFVGSVHTRKLLKLDK